MNIASYLLHLLYFARVNFVVYAYIIFKQLFDLGEDISIAKWPAFFTKNKN